MKFSNNIDYSFVVVDSKLFIFLTIVLSVTRASFSNLKQVSYQVLVIDVI
jgi:hypothetical protein